MKNIYILSYLLLLFSINMFSQDFDIDQISKDVDIKIKADSIKDVRKENRIIKKRERNWYNGSMVPIVSIDRYTTVGFRLNNEFYIDFKSNGGWWGRDKPRSSSGANYYNTDYSHVVTMTDNNLIQEAAHIDDFDAIFLILNAGYNFPVIKTKSITLSAFAGAGISLTRKVTYDRFLNANSFSSFQGTWWAELRESKTNANINAGIEIAIRDLGGILIGMDSTTSTFHLGWVILL